MQLTLRFRDARADVDCLGVGIAEGEARVLGVLQNVADAIPPEEAPPRDIVRCNEKESFDTVLVEDSAGPVVVVEVTVVEGNQCWPPWPRTPREMFAEISWIQQ